MGFIKMDALEKAEEDCSKALQIDCTYVKAWSRRGLTRFKRGKYSQVGALRLFSISFSFDYILAVIDCPPYCTTLVPLVLVYYGDDSFS